MTVDGNVETLRGLLDHFNETGEIEYEGKIHPEVELHDRPDVPDGEVWHGHPGIDGFFAKTRELFDPIHRDFQELIPEGRHVITRTHVTAYGASSGTPIEMDEAQLWTSDEQ